jgi:hypothetical protein
LIMNNFDDDIRKKLDDLEVAPPHYIWASIENRLDNKKKSGTVLWKYPAAAAAAVLLLVSSALLWLPSIFNFGAEQLVLDSSPVQDASQLFDNQEENSSDRNLQLTPDFISSQEIKNMQSHRETVAANSSESHRTITISAGNYPILITNRGITVSTLVPANPKHLIAAKSPEKVEPDIQPDNNSTLVLAYHQPTSSSPYSLTAYFAPQQSYRFQTGYAPSLETLESQILSFSTGLMINKRLNNRWEIQSGLAYNLIGQLVHDIASFSHPSQIPLYSNNGMLISRHPQRMSTSMGGIVFTDQSLYFADISSSRITTLKGSYDETVVNLLNRSGSGLMQHFQLLEVPVSVRYKIINRPFEVSAKAGLSVHYLLSSKVYLQGNPMNNPIGHSVGVNKLNLGASGGLVFSYPVTHLMKINLEPTASMFVRPMGQIRNLNNSTYPYTWSVLLGISHGF